MVPGTTEVLNVELIPIMKINKLVLIADVESKIHKHMEDKINIPNVLNFYQLTKLFNVSHLKKTNFTYIQRCFTMLVETQNFLELDFTSISKILASSGLLITSEHEVYNAANAWVSHYIEERSKFAENLLLKVRLPLLSDETLKFLLNKSSSFSNNDACRAKFEEILNNKDEFIENNCSNYYTHRCCNQDCFNILICGGRNVDFGIQKVRVVNTVNQISRNKFESQKVLPPMIEQRLCSKAVCLKGDVYVFGGSIIGSYMKTVEKYSHSTNSWTIVTDMFDDRKHFCVCAFMDKIIIIGGSFYGNLILNVTDSCLVFDTKDKKWKEVARMNQVREFAACAVFEGRIVVSGGTDNNHNKSNTVESYDVVGDKWSPMPNMTSSNCNHSLVVAKNKLFVIGEEICEVYHNSTKLFVAIKPQPIVLYLNRSISIGSEIIVFQSDDSSVFCYDVDKDEWSEKSCEITQDLDKFSCMKIPWF